MGVRYSQHLADRAQAWLALPLNEKRQPAGLEELGNLWATMQGLPPVRCRQCQYAERSASVAAYLREFSHLPTFTSMSDTPASTYQLAPAYAAQTLVHEDYNKAVTADNLTDEDAEFFIGKGYVSQFIKKAEAAIDATISNVESTVGGAFISLGQKIEGDDAADQDQPTEREQELQTQLDNSATAYSQLTEVYAQLQTSSASDLATAQAALDSEKVAHETTKSQLSEVQAQLATALAIIAALPPAQLQKATVKAQPSAGTDSTDGSDSTSQAPMSASTTPASTTPTSDTPASESTPPASPAN